MSTFCSSYFTSLMLLLWVLQIFRKEPFFYGHDNQDQLVKIARVMHFLDLQVIVVKDIKQCHSMHQEAKAVEIFLHLLSSFYTWLI